jgi:HAD superfamily hydrolase (TIGR01490 family)
MAGLAADELAAQGDAYAAELVPRLHPALLKRIDWHRGQGHELVLVSASLGAYLEPLGSRLGFATVLATELEVGDDARLTGHLMGLNVRGEEKLRRLEAWLGGDPRVLWVYGDSAGDSELLAAADNPHRCRRGRIVGLRSERDGPDGREHEGGARHSQK